MKYMFFYGTLREGEGNHRHFIGDLKATKKNAVTKAEFTMWSNGGYPGVARGGKQQIVGDVFAIPEERIKPLDLLEGHPDYYRREFVKLEDGQDVEMYLVVDGVPDHPRIIKSGDWLKYKGGD